MTTITPHLWFDTEAQQAAELYTSLFDGSEITHVRTLHGTPRGDADVVSFVLAGQPFMAISAGPLFTFNPSVSFTIACRSADEVDGLWDILIEGGSALMPLDAYPFSDRYGWLQDRYGLSWQIMHTGNRDITQKIVPMLMFVGDVCGKAQEAVSFYTSVFDNSSVGEISRYGPDEAPEREGHIQHVAFSLDGFEFAALDSARDHRFAFNEAISFMVQCDTQEQIDYYWDRLSAVPEAEQCGWLKDRFGVSWQIVPRAMDTMIHEADEPTLARVTEAFLSMKKFDLGRLEEAYAGV